MKSLTLALCAATLSLAAALPASSSYVKHEKREAHETAHNIVARADGDAMLPVRIGMTQSNLDKGHNILMDISRHDSPNYGNHLSAEDIHELFAPSKDRVDALIEWLESEGIDKKRVSQSVNKQWLQFDAPIAELEKLVKTEYHIYEHDSGKMHVGCEEYSVPDHLVDHIDYITPGVTRLALKARSMKRTVSSSTRAHGRPPPVATPYSGPAGNIDASGDLSNCDAAITPACIFALYNITKGTLKASGNELGIFETNLQFYTQADLNDYFARLYPTIPQGTTPELRLIDGSPGPNGNEKTAGIEAVLDFEISYPLIWPQNSVLFAVDDEYYQANETNYKTGKYLPGFGNTFLDAIDGSYCSYEAFGAAVPSPLDPSYPDPAPDGYKGKLQCGVYKPTNVISISYGEGEADLPVKYFKRQCNEYMKLGMQGVTVAIATGDYGVASFPGDQSPNGCLPKSASVKGNIFSSQFPNACPYILNVGSTTLPAGSNARMGSETATTRFGSSGGFSNVFPTADYQQEAVSSYLRNYPPKYASYNLSNGETMGENGGRYNSGGRGFPDVSALGDSALLWSGGGSFTVGGTSMAAPIFASVVNRLNEERLALGKKTVGFVNPVFYAHPGIFQDVTIGNNPGCGSQGFEAAPGWDPVTGLGTPNYSKMLALFKKLP